MSEARAASSSTPTPATIQAIAVAALHSTPFFDKDREFWTFPSKQKVTASLFRIWGWEERTYFVTHPNVTTGSTTFSVQFFVGFAKDGEAPNYWTPNGDFVSVVLNFDTDGNLTEYGALTGFGPSGVETRGEVLRLVSALGAIDPAIAAGAAALQGSYAISQLLGPALRGSDHLSIPSFVGLFSAVVADAVFMAYTKSDPQKDIAKHLAWSNAAQSAVGAWAPITTGWNAKDKRAFTVEDGDVELRVWNPWCVIDDSATLTVAARFDRVLDAKSDDHVVMCIAFDLTNKIVAALQCDVSFGNDAPLSVIGTAPDPNTSAFDDWATQFEVAVAAFRSDDKNTLAGMIVGQTANLAGILATWVPPS